MLYLINGVLELFDLLVFIVESKGVMIWYMISDFVGIFEFLGEVEVLLFV